jgi:hypothetical protein
MKCSDGQNNGRPQEGRQGREGRHRGGENALHLITAIAGTETKIQNVPVPEILW